MTGMTGKELAEIAFRAIQNDHILWSQWHDVKTVRERDHMLLVEVSKYVARFCIGEVYAAHEPSDAVDAIREQFGE